MGWATGSGLMSDIIENLNETDLDEEARMKVYEVLISSFENYDCDTLHECTGTDNVFDEIFYSMYPPENDDYENENSGC